MLAIVEHLSVKRRGVFSWLKKVGQCTVHIKAGEKESEHIVFSKRRSCSLGLALEYAGQADSPVVVVSFKNERIEIRPGEGFSSLPFRGKKYSGSVSICVVAGSYFEHYEQLDIQRHATSFSETVQENQETHIRRMYDGETYTVDLRSLETEGYAPILRNATIYDAHMTARQEHRSMQLIDPDSADAEFIKKIQKLREVPKMFISSLTSVMFSLDRENALASFFEKFNNPSDRRRMRKKIVVKFRSELGQDHGALRKEFFEITAAALVQDERFVLENGLFDFCSAEDLKLSRVQNPNPQRSLDIDDQTFYIFTGFFISQVVFQQVQINIRFSRSFYRALLREKGVLEDVTDQQLRQSIRWIEENSVDELSFTFKSGKGVIDPNKHLFIEELIYEETFGKRPGYRPMVDSFHQIVSSEILRFTPEELARLTSGLEVVSLDYLIKTAIYKNCTERTPEVAYFWEIMRTESEAFRKKALLFITGSSSIQFLPGLVNEAITIEKSDLQGGLPSAHACFRQLVLCSYESMAQLKAKLHYAINETEGFHFV
ncbi:atrophin-1 interacting protein 2 (WW domain containing E3 ubiquitin protein ligase 2) [Nematocida displodere]|uniref:HECT-type E3 ubiquitin transferase n=1 Tax=Nematocida displodere TaxID=1805483 RepID=A0A177EIE2_9MICR|nr:atrophin-1 interacting protein 2 (WW domain containing E3 ubiquitin protein ligase 2) [Nematocida displodere]